MTQAEFWDECKKFDWSYLTSLDRNATLEGCCAMTELRKVAAQHGPEYEQILNRFRKAYMYSSCYIPPRPAP